LPRRQAVPEPEPPRPRLATPRLILAVVALLGTHYALAASSLPRENPTVDEVIHLPAGISYWQTGTFKLYPHNPPLVKLVAALPALASAPRTERLYHGPYWRGPYPNKAGFAHEFAFQNATRYFEIFGAARLAMPTFSVLGGLVVFLWSRRLYGDGGGLLSLALWCLCPNILAHARLVTTDVGATVLGFGATYAFTRSLRRPSWPGAAGVGVALGLAQLSKFSMLLLPGLWSLIWLLHETLARPRDGRRARLAGAIGRGAGAVALCVLTIDLGYGFEGVGRPLGDFEFACSTLTRPEARPVVPANGDALLRLAWHHRVNRFRGTALGSFPAPLPAYYLIGFDLQKLEAEGIPKLWLRPPGAGPRPADGEWTGYTVFLDGQLRETGWWSYYTLALAYKVPEGTLILAALSLVILATTRRPRAAWADEGALLLVPAAVLGVMSFGTDINLGLRYVLPMFPYVFVFTGKLVPWAAGRERTRRRLAIAGISAGLGATALATAMIHPSYLASFNWASGGPGRGSEHLIDSNLDWGQDLVGLREWARKHAPGERIGLAYFGQINPEVFNLRGDVFDWSLPPALPGSWQDGGPRSPGASSPPPPGLYAVSASLMRGLPWRVYDRTAWAPFDAKPGAFAYFADLAPIAQVGHSILIYRVNRTDAAKLAAKWARPATPP